MEINWIGFVAATSAFVGIWLGHVSVRKLEAISPTIWLPALVAVLIGAALVTCSLLTSNLYISLTTGILGITVLWDALEFPRQHRRVAKGHAPANPNNPRHARLLTRGRATRVDLLKRNPVGRQVSPDEAVRLVGGDSGGGN